MENNKQQIRPHLTKECRLPRCFKEVEKVLRSVKSCKQNYKTVLANSRLRGHIHKKVYSMTVNILKYYSYIQSIIDKVQLLEKEQYLKREIATVLIYELLFGNGFLPGKSKIIKIIQLYENEIFRAHEVLQNKAEDNLIIEFNIPRYVRVHTLVTTVPYVIKDLTSYGFQQVIYDNDLSVEKYFELVENLNKGSFLVDFHFKDVLVFEHHENLVSLDLYKNGHIFLQDKSSYIPVHVLNPQPGDAVLDACAAPGMKTIHIAAKMKNKGILIANERDKSRFECLKEMLECGSVKICKTFCKDFKLIDPYDQAYSTIEYILLDPSCSGSGMVNRMDEVTDTENSKNNERLMKLAGFQIILLKHALKFPAVKRVVYSTCSIHEEENEYVVHEALNAFSGIFKLIPAMPEWSHRGSEKFEFGKLCLRTDPKVHLTNGFFVAVFERIDYDHKYAEESVQNFPFHNVSTFKKQKRKSSKSEENWEKVKVEDNREMNLKHEYNISHTLGSDQMNNSGHVALINKTDVSCIQNVDYEMEHNMEYEQINKNQKKKKKEKSNESKENKNNENSDQVTDNNLMQNMDYAQQINKKWNKKKREKSNEYYYESEKNKNIENSAQNSNSKLEQNMEYAEQINKKQKKKKRKKFNEELNLETNESVLNSSKFIEHSNISSLESDNDVSTHMKKDKPKHHNKSDLYQNTEVIEEFPNVTKLHKNKKKKKDHFETKTLHSDEFTKEKQKISKSNKFNLQSELEDNSNDMFISKTASVQNKNLRNTSCEDSEHFISAYSHKEKKKKKVNKHESVSGIAVNYEIPEEIADLTLLHKKKKKKKHGESFVEDDI